MYSFLQYQLNKYSFLHLNSYFYVPQKWTITGDGVDNIYIFQDIVCPFNEINNDTHYITLQASLISGK